ncbi:MAG: RNA 2',3'-cyclic phosphodiesterase [Bacteroidetes bacterium]|nr:RNA 2',3'-cyclic phosphodiesterase [Bacteroidota bacterium]
MTSRLFISLEIPEYIQEEIIKLRQEIYGVGAERIRWEEKEKLHLTLKFLGEIDSTLESQICSALHTVSSKYQSLHLEFSKFGLFLRSGIPSILWVGIKNNDLLLKLQRDIDNQLSRLNIKKDKRKFSAHITILRLKGKENMEQINNFMDYSLENYNFTASKITLMKSQLLQKGSVYTALKSFYIR